MENMIHKPPKWRDMCVSLWVTHCVWLKPENKCLAVVPHVVTCEHGDFAHSTKCFPRWSAVRVFTPQNYLWTRTVSGVWAPSLSSCCFLSIYQFSFWLNLKDTWTFITFYKSGYKYLNDQSHHISCLTGIIQDGLYVWYKTLLFYLPFLFTVSSAAWEQVLLWPKFTQKEEYVTPALKHHLQGKTGSLRKKRFPLWQ